MRRLRPGVTAPSPRKDPELKAEVSGKGQKILIRQGIVVTMSEDARDLAPGDVLIEAGRIAAIDRRIDAPDAFVIDAKNMIVIPGMIDTHRHTWQSTLHAVGPDWLLSEYFGAMRGVLGPVYRPEDLYAATYLGAIKALLIPASPRSSIGRI